MLIIHIIFVGCFTRDIPEDLLDAFVIESKFIATVLLFAHGILLIPIYALKTYLTENVFLDILRFGIILLFLQIAQTRVPVLNNVCNINWPNLLIYLREPVYKTHLLLVRFLLLGEVICLLYILLPSEILSRVLLSSESLSSIITVMCALLFVPSDIRTQVCLVQLLFYVPLLVNVLVSMLCINMFVLSFSTKIKIKDVTPGTVLKHHRPTFLRCFILYSHFEVVVDVNHKKEMITTIGLTTESPYWSKLWRRGSYGISKIEKKERKFKDITNYSNIAFYKDPLNNETVVNNAIEALKRPKKEYSLWNYNCEHFANECKTGEPLSLQSNIFTLNWLGTACSGNFALLLTQDL